MKAFVHTTPTDQPDRAFLVWQEYPTLGEAVDGAHDLLRNVNPQWIVADPVRRGESEMWRVTPSDNYPGILVTAGRAGIPGGLEPTLGLGPKEYYVTIQIPHLNR